MRKKVLFLSALLVSAFIFIKKDIFFKNQYAENEQEKRYEEEGESEQSHYIASEIDRLIRLKPDQEVPDYPAGYQITAFLNVNRGLPSNARTEETLNWVERGPGNLAGRARAILVDKADRTNRTWLIGSAGGGIWKTTNEGDTWRNVTPNIPNLATVCLAQCTDNPRVIYAGTGEGAFGNGQTGINGSGMLKSTDGGETWQLLSSTLPSNSNDFFNVNRIIVDPKNENILLAATSNGVVGATFLAAIMRSIDGGQTWTRVYSGFSWVQQIEADPKDFNKQYASVRRRGIVKSTDGGRTWRETLLTGIIASFVPERIEFSISPVNPKKIYASVAHNNRTGSSLCYSNDEGETWRIVEDRGRTDLKDFLQQGDYNNAIVAHPFEENTVVWGGTEIWRAFIFEDQIREGEKRFLGVTGTNINFLTFTTVSGWRFGGGTVDIRDSTQISNVEVRFGKGKTQKAHRFNIEPLGSGAGVPANRYIYQDYVDVPFEVWDTEKNRQLMISFRDQENNKVFNLNVREDSDTQLLTNREYLYIHDLTYSATEPDANIAKNGGHTYLYMYNIWPYLTAGNTWNPNNLPEAVLKFNVGKLAYQGAGITEITTNRTGGMLNGKVHVDHHHFVTYITDAAQKKFRWITANDGGIAYTDNEGTAFIAKDKGMNTNQYYSAVKKVGANEYLAGPQDGQTVQSPAGVQASLSTPYNERFATVRGDGFEVVWHTQTPNLMLGSNQRNVIIKSTNGGTTWANSVSGLTDTGTDNTKAPFFTKIANSAANPNLVFAVSTSGIWRSTDFADKWTLVPMSDQWAGFLDIEVSDVNANIVWAGGGMSNTSSLFVSENGGFNFTPVAKFSKALGNITTIVPDPNDSRTAYATFSQYRSPKILRTTDLGQTWEDISGFGATGTKSENGFPDVATFCILPFPDKQKLWVGTEIGLFESLDNGKTWKYANNGLPAVHIWDMKVRDGQVVVATHGRGIWTVDLGITYPNQQTPVGLFSNLPEAKPATIYPNPSQGNVVLELPQNSIGKFEIGVFNAIGQQVFTAKNASAGKISLDLSNLQRGVYVLKAYNGKELFTGKMIIEK
ncbi:MAG: T9SS C-terminal target domain-containing protein [Cytophagales bacterium]|nr:MAG: T9SS C-terminal target domain-containing protein [Cytophagales bacterium]